MIHGPNTIQINTIKNISGKLSVLSSEDIVFPVKRVFWISDVPKLGMRGGHAHRTCKQLLTVIQGEVEYTITHREQFPPYKISALEERSLYIPPMYWLDLRFLRPKTIVMVLCDQDYNEKDYIRNRVEYDNIIQQSSVGVS